MNHIQSLRSRISGPVFSVITPFRAEDDGIDFSVLEQYLTRVYLAGGRIFYVMGYNSRFSELSWDEIKVLNAFVTKTVQSLGNDAIVIVADPLHCSTAVSIEFARHAEDIGADVISLVFREKFYSNEQVFRHYSLVEESCGVGILIHEMPFISGHGGHTVNWPIDLLDQLADLEKIIAIKEDAKNDTYSNEVIARIKDRVSIIISGGGKRQWLNFTHMGCQSWLNGIGVFEPALAVNFWAAWQQKETDFCQAMIDRIEVPFFENVVDQYGWHLGIKAALEARGIMSRHERMPMLAIDEKQFRRVQEVMASLPIEDFVNR